MHQAIAAASRSDGGSSDLGAPGTAGRLEALRDRAAMPDIASGPATDGSPRIDRVGMFGIQSMIRIADERGEESLLPAEVDADVSLDDPSARGIHMSRLYLALQHHLERHRLDLAAIEAILGEFLRSHRGLSGRSGLSVRFTLPLRRQALRSRHGGWRHYPVIIAGRADEGGTSFEQTVEVTYSSTCPCSAALSRQVAQEAFDAEFGDRESLPVDALRAWLGSPDGMPATPHSQRSVARVTVVPTERDGSPSLCELIDRIESALATPVQTAVKREDEQHFARLNGANLMFCEDAARRVHAALIGVPGLSDHRVRIDHRESLHAHDASAVIVRNVPHGLRP